jgi:hypothetical protein
LALLSRGDGVFRVLCSSSTFGTSNTGVGTKGADEEDPEVVVPETGERETEDSEQENSVIDTEGCVDGREKEKVLPPHCWLRRVHAGD